MNRQFDDDEEDGGTVRESLSEVKRLLGDDDDDELAATQLQTMDSPVLATPMATISRHVVAMRAQPINGTPAAAPVPMNAPPPSGANLFDDEGGTAVTATAYGDDFATPIPEPQTHVEEPQQAYLNSYTAQQAHAAHARAAPQHAPQAQPAFAPPAPGFAAQPHAAQPVFAAQSNAAQPFAPHAAQPGFAAQPQPAPQSPFAPQPAFTPQAAFAPPPDAPVFDPARAQRVSSPYIVPEQPVVNPHVVARPSAPQLTRDANYLEHQAEQALAAQRRISQPLSQPPPFTDGPPRSSARIATPVPFESPATATDARVARLAGLSLEKGATPASAPAPARSSKLPWVLLVLVIVGGGYYIRTLQNNRGAGTDQKPAVATPTTNTPEPSHAGLLASGYIAAKTPIVLSATTGGRLQAVSVEAGDTITKGQLVAQIDDGAIRAELSLAGARVRDAERLHQRTKMLVKAQAATPSDLERAVGAVEVARAEYRVTSQKLDVTRIKSPINGTVLEVLAHTGEAITLGPNGGAGILRIADLSALIAEVDVAETELKAVYVGQAAELVTESQRGRTYRGVVREIAEQADRARGTVLVKVDVLPDEPSPGAGSGSGSAADAPKDPKPEAPAPEVKDPKKDAEDAKKDSKKRDKKDPRGKDPKKDGKPDVASGSAAGSGAPAAPANTEKLGSGLRPGMAVQVRFLPKPTPPPPT